MSLQVWLPLTKDLRNQGLSNTAITNHGATFNSNGKLGGCYSFDGTDDNLSYTPSVDGIETLSVAFWVCPTAATPAGSFFSLERGTYWQLTFYGNYVAIRDNSIGYSGTRKNFSTGTYIANTWTHIAVTYDKGTLKIYRDGSLLSTNSVGGTKLNTSIDNARIGSAVQSGYYYSGKMNDVRIYDNCLSLMEIKQLAQGLVLHYPLNRRGFGQENLGNTSATYSNQTNGQTISASGWGGDAGTVTCYHSGGYNNYPYKVYHKTATGSGGIYYKTANDIDIKANTTYTMSVYIKASRNFLGNAYSFNINRGSDNYYINFGQSMQFTTEWKRITKTFTTDADAAGKYGEMSIIYDDDATDYYIYYSGFKIEEGSIATPWCPNSSDALAITMGLNSTTEYDCSGFCNNGSKMTDTITYTSDTAKYAISTHFNGTYDGILIENLQLSDIINSAVTYAFWIKPESESSARSVYFGSYNTGPSWSIEKTTGNVMRSYWNGSPDETCSGATITDGVWQHVCLTKSGTNDIKVYINGVQKWASTATHSNLSFPTTYRIGRDTRSNDGTPYKGLMSDFRIYATALSADDVKSLYQNCATIDPDGTIRGQIRS